MQNVVEGVPVMEVTAGRAADQCLMNFALSLESAMQQVALSLLICCPALT